MFQYVRMCPGAWEIFGQAFPEILCRQMVYVFKNIPYSILTTF